ncbi:MAG: signal peptidase II [Deltaproteobacteria bacterium]|nr:signal peptidase II [Deltaproteobacteria bacterium]
MRRYPLLAISGLIFLADLISKKYVETILPINGSIEYTSFFSLVHVRNYGGAFSLLSDFKYSFIIFTIFPLSVIAILVFMFMKTDQKSSKNFPILLILGGASGNLFDRITKGFVVDFLDFHYKDLHWPAFNVADISITTGVLLWIIIELKSNIRSING